MAEKFNRSSIFEVEELEFSIKETVETSFKLIRKYKQELNSINDVGLLDRMRTQRKLESYTSGEIASIAYQNFSNLPKCEKGYADFILILNTKKEKIGKRLTKRIIDESISRIDGDRSALKKFLRLEAKRKVYHVGNYDI